MLISSSQKLMMVHFLKYCPFGKTNPLQKNITTSIQTLSLALTITLICLVCLHLLRFFYSSSSLPWLKSHINSLSFRNKCEIFRGNWVYHPNKRPVYSNFTCPEIFDQQNCLKFGRPDSEFMKWRWKPTECELPPFEAAQFLELVKGKTMAFVGDSVARNQMQSLLCLLATVEYPTDVSYTTDAKFKLWLYDSYNFTLASFWSPYLVKARKPDPKYSAQIRLMDLYLDRADTAWTAQMESFDYVIISAARWFFLPAIYHENDRVIGCHSCQSNDIKNLTMSYAHKRAFRTAFKALLRLKSFKGEIILRTLSPAHFENGEWKKGGECNRTEPVFGSEMKLRGSELELYLGQIEELRDVEKEGEKRGLKFRLMDITEAMVVRPDAHPNHFGHWPHENVTLADCVHWCLPGPIDTWNELLLHMLKHDSK